MQLNRRNFLASSSVLALAAGAPEFLQRIARAAPASDRPGGKQTVLVVVELTGGNDGLNTVIPYRDPAYAEARPTLKQAPADVLKIDDNVALHPALKGLAPLLEKSQLSVIQGVGYPAPNRSHFESMDIWHKATPAKEERYGWLGRSLPKLGNAGIALQIGSEQPTLALISSVGNAPALRSLDEYQLKVAAKGDDPARRQAIEGLARESSASGDSLRDLIRQSARETYRSAASLREVGRSYKPATTYPATALAERLKLVAQLIDAGVSERVYYTSLAGFDTHAQQAGLHTQLLEQLGGALGAFQADLAQHGHADRVLTLTFSEFGRRVKENGSQGTDHGAAAPMFAIGGKVRAGAIGAHPSLTDLDDGDLKHHTDFRSVYATVLDRWLEVGSREILGAEYPALPFLQEQKSG